MTYPVMLCMLVQGNSGQVDSFTLRNLAPIGKYKSAVLSDNQSWQNSVSRWRSVSKNGDMCTTNISTRVGRSV